MVGWYWGKLTMLTDGRKGTGYHVESRKRYKCAGLGEREMFGLKARQQDEDVVLCPSRKFHVRALTSEHAAERLASRALPEQVTSHSSLVWCILFALHRRRQCFLCGETMSDDAGIVTILRDGAM